MFIGYPFLILLISKYKRNHAHSINDQLEKDLPSVTLIVTAKNEEDVIEHKINNSLNLDYPKDKIEYIFVSDGSTDNTAKILTKYSGIIKTIILEKNVGKTEAQNIAVAQANGDILVFSDANTMLSKLAIKKLVRHFQNEKVAGVSGNLIYSSKFGDRNTEYAYNKFDAVLRKAESRFGMVLGSYGALYAIRANKYIPLPPYVISDFVEPSMQLINGYFNLFEEEAFGIEEANNSIIKEMRRKERIILRSLVGYHYLLKNGLLQRKGLLFHSFIRKFLRWMLPFYTMCGIIGIAGLLFEESLVDFSVFLMSLFLLLVITYVMIKKNLIKGKLVRYFAYFYILNIASLKALFRFLIGERPSSWNPRQ
ncbi:glycosyltransferase [Kosmotoga sp. DU53]|uniref:glycosyltransferase n=1 Tax=Kosmotoga sp. DU53 TaxID=1310160 RepID=UPI00137363F4|nr:glycosyltransferase [Kosmotoga sp. DU53]